MIELKTKVLVVGAGPGGYVAAIRAGQLGLDTVLVEADRLGGTCLIRGCIPSKALIQVAGEFDHASEAASAPRFGMSLESPPSLDFSGLVEWKDSVVDRLSNGVAGLLKRAKVKVVPGWANFTDAKTCTVKGPDGVTQISAEHVVLATGSTPFELANLPGGGKVISSTEALSLAERPKRLAIVGAGYIGLEMGCAFAKLGVEVTIVEAQAQILPQYDEQLVAPVAKWLKARGVTVHLGAVALSEKPSGLSIKTAEGKTQTVKADKILVTVGRRPLTEGWGRENMALEMAGPFVRVDDQCRTSTCNVWAIGDLIGEPMLAHKATAQGELVAEIIAGKRRRFEPVAVPAVCFTEPEIVTVGQAPGAAGTMTGSFPFLANGRALTMGNGDEGGFVRVVADKQTHRIVGIQAVGPHVSELSAAFTQAIEMGAVLEDISGMIHAHPTLGEALHEATLKALGHAIHI